MELISRETIKPFAPTPPNLTIYPFSLIDHIVTPNSVPLLYFCQNQSRREHDNNTDEEESSSKTILTLKKSLSKVLSKYYPLAGRLIKLHDYSKSPLGETEVKFQLTRDTLEAMLRSMTYISEQLSAVGTSSGLANKKQK